MQRVLGIDVGAKNLGLCLLERTGKILFWDVVTLRNMKKMPCAVDVYNALRGIQAFEDADTVVIERQPPSNPGMCKIQHYLEYHCATLDKPVRVQDAKVKLGYAMTMPWWPEDGDTSSYYRRKKTAVKAVENYLKWSDTSCPDQQTIQRFHGSTKKDDFADSLLHALASM